MRLLVVEDDPTVRRLIEVTVRDLGDVTTASSEDEALSKLSSAPDVVILDLGLPEIRWDLLRAALSQQIRVVVVTGHVEPTIIEQAEKIGAHEVITKPFRPADLVSAVKGTN